MREGDEIDMVEQWEKKILLDSESAAMMNMENGLHSAWQGVCCRGAEPF